MKSRAPKGEIYCFFWIFLYFYYAYRKTETIYFSILISIYACKINNRHNLHLSKVGRLYLYCFSYIRFRSVEVHASAVRCLLS